MFCKRCGTEIKDDSNFCPMCGAQLDNAEVKDLSSCDSVEISEYSARKFGMGWFKFLIYFALWAGGILNILDGITYSTGHFTGDAEVDDLLFDYFPELRTMLVIFGIIIISVGLFNIFTRFALAQFRKIGPICLYITYGAAFVINLAMATSITLITEISAFNISTVTQLVVSLVFLIVNIFYFKKRANLFVR